MTHWLGIMVGILLLGCTPMMATPTHTKSMQAESIHAESTHTEPKYIAQAQTTQGRGQNLPISAYATIAGRKFELEVAKTPQQQQIGLMYRTSLADNRGMLFVFASPQPTRFWMKNTLIPLDMIFLREGQVMAVEAAVPPCKTTTCPTYGTDTPIDQVIELRGGTIAQINLKVGDRIKIQYID